MLVLIDLVLVSFWSSKGPSVTRTMHIGLKVGGGCSRADLKKGRRKRKVPTASDVPPTCPLYLCFSFYYPAVYI